MLYFLVPWTAVNLVDFYFVRNGHYAISEIFNPEGIYGHWGRPGLSAYLAGLLAMVPFMSLSFYSGPFAVALGGADVAFVVGLLVAGAVYAFMCRALDLEAERRLATLGERLLEEGGA